MNEPQKVLQPFKIALIQYFTKLGMIPQDNLETELLGTLLQELKKNPPQVTPKGKKFYQENKKELRYESTILGSNDYIEPEKLQEKLIDFVFDQNLLPKETEIAVFDMETVVYCEIIFQDRPMSLTLHSYKKPFSKYSFKHPFVIDFIIV